jgi:isorenieratene synthase
MNDRFPVVVVGGGIAGLTAALHLAERGIEPLVLEADNEWIGGRLAGGDPDTFVYEGREWSFPTEHGMHAIWGGYINMLSMIDRFLDITLIESGGEEWINRWANRVRFVEAGSVVRRSWLPAPLHYIWLLLRPRFWDTINIFDFLALPGFVTSVLWTLSVDPIKEGVRFKGLKMHDFFVGWTPNLRMTFSGIGINMLASNAEDINLNAFIAAIRFYTMLRRDSWIMRYLPTNAHDGLIKPLVEQIERRGGMIVQGARARELVKCGDGWQVRFEDARLGGIRTLEAQHVILALNPDAAARLFADSHDLPHDEIEIPDVTRSSTVRLWFDREPRHGAPGGMFTGDFSMDNFFWLHRLQPEFLGWNLETGGSCIEVHIYNRNNIIDRPERYIKALIANEVQMAFPELRGHLVHATYRSNGYHQTQFDIPSLSVETPWKNVYACGDWIGYDTPSFWMERSTITGIAAANCVLQAYDKDPFDILESPRPELPARVIMSVMKGLRAVFGPPVVAIARRRKNSSN